MKKYNVAILGATGAVGTEFLKLIEERNVRKRSCFYVEIWFIGNS